MVTRGMNSADMKPLAQFIDNILRDTASADVTQQIKSFAQSFSVPD